jgi:hypothetical protein
MFDTREGIVVMERFQPSSGEIYAQAKESTKNLRYFRK